MNKQHLLKYAPPSAVCVAALLLCFAATAAEMPAFFSRLDLSLPGLTAVREAVDRNDAQAAAKAWAGYMRERCTRSGIVWGDSGAAPETMGPLGTLLALIRERGGSENIVALDTLFRGAPTDEAILTATGAADEILASLASGAQTLSGPARQASSTIGLLYSGFFYEFKKARELFNEFEQAASAGIADLPLAGFPNNMSPSETAAHIEWLAVGVALAKVGGPLTLSPAEKTLERARALAEDLLYLCSPDALFKEDSAAGSLHPYAGLDDGAALPPRFCARILWVNVPPPPDIDWLIAGGVSDFPPVFTTWPRTFSDPTPDWYVFRQNWSPKSLCLAADYSPKTPETNQFQGAFTLNGQGLEMISGAFGAPPVSPPSTPANNKTDIIPLFYTLDALDYVSGTAGPVTDRVRGAYPAHTRTIVYVKPNFIVVADHVAGMLSTPISWGVEIAPGMNCDLTANEIKATYSSGASLSMSVVGNVAPPTLEPLDSGATKLLFEKEWRLPAAWAAVYYPFAPGEDAKADIAADPADRGFGRALAIKITPEDSPVRHVLFINNERGPSQFPDHDLLLGGKAALFDVQMRPRGKYALIRRMTFIETSAVAYRRKSSEWVMSFDAPFTGLIEFNPRGGFPGGRVLLDASSKVRQLTMRLRVRAGAALELPIFAGENVNIEPWEQEQKED